MAKMRSYYWLCPKGYKDESIAYAPEGTPLSHYLIDSVKDLDELPFSLTLHDVKITDSIKIGPISNAEPIDYVANSLAWPIMSERMKSIIDSGLNGNEGLRWLSVRIMGLTKVFKYYIPVFTVYLDTIDRDKTIYSDKEREWMVKPYYKAEEVNKYAVFHENEQVFWQITTGIYVRSDIMKRMKSEGITGISHSCKALLV
jgi:hypothetical protein